MFGAFLLLANLAYFIPITFQIVSTDSTDCNLGIVVLRMTTVTHLLLIPAIWTWIDKDKKQLDLLAMNSLGTIWVIFWIVFLM